jgi:hypothetical protein
MRKFVITILKIRNYELTRNYDLKTSTCTLFFLFSGHEPIYFIENKEKTLRASYDRGTQIFDYME